MELVSAKKDFSDEQVNSSTPTKTQPVLDSLRKIQNYERKRGINSVSLFAKGAYYYNVKDYKKAKFYFEKTALVNYDNTLITCLMKTCNKLNYMHDMKSHFEKAKETLEKSGTFWQLYGYLEFELKNHDSAADCFLMARRLGFEDTKLNEEFLSGSLDLARRVDELYEFTFELIKNGNNEPKIVDFFLSSAVETSHFKEAHQFFETTSFDWRAHAKLNALAALTYNAVEEDAEKCIELNLRAAELDPSNVRIKWNLGLTQLRLGQIKSGIENYKIRFDWEEFPSPRRIFNVPKWHENVPKYARILIWTEQGLGDEILFSSAIQAFIKKFPNIIFETHSKTTEIMQIAFPDIHCRTGVYKKDDLTSLYNDFEYQVPLGDVFLWFLEQNIASLENGNNLENLNYLQPDRLRSFYWKEKLSQKSSKPKVGFAWTSANLEMGRGNHHTSLYDWSDMLRRDDVDFVSIQYNFDYEQIASQYPDLADCFCNTGFLDQMDDLEGAIALISNLDLVISSPSSASHLAGAAGVPTWYYGATAPFMLGRKGDFVKNPFFPNMQLYITKDASQDKNLPSIFNQRLDMFLQK